MHLKKESWDTCLGCLEFRFAYASPIAYCLHLRLGQWGNG
jgi:hypothetical protein